MKRAGKLVKGEKGKVSHECDARGRWSPRLTSGMRWEERG